MGRPARFAGVAAVGERLPVVARFAGRRKMGIKWGATLLFAPFEPITAGGAALFEPTRGLEPLTARLQVGCATNCATSAGHGNKSRDKDRDNAGENSGASAASARQSCARREPDVAPMGAPALTGHPWSPDPS